MSKAIIRLNIFVFLYSLIANFVHPVTPTFIQMLGLHNYMFGLAFGMMSLANFLFSPFWGKMAERLGPGRIISMSVIGYGCMQLIFGLSTKEWHICVARFFGGFFISATSVAEIVYIMQNSEDVGKDLAMMSMNNTIVSQFGFLIGGFIGLLGVRLTFFIQAAGLACLGIYAGFALKDKSRGGSVPITVKDINPFADFIATKDVLNTYTVLFLAIAAMASLGATCYEQCFNYYIKDVFGFPSSYNGMVKAVIGFICFALNYLVAMKIIRRGRCDRSIIWIFAVMIVLMLGVIGIDAFIPFLIVNILFFGVNSIVKVMTHNMIADHTGKEGAKTAGIYNSISMLGNVGGSFLAGFVYEVSPKSSFVVSAAAIACCLVLAVVHLKAGIKLKEKA